MQQGIKKTVESMFYQINEKYLALDVYLYLNRRLKKVDSKFSYFLYPLSAVNFVSSCDILCDPVTRENFLPRERQYFLLFYM